MCKPTFLPTSPPDTAARRRISTLLRQFALRRCTPEEFDERYQAVMAKCDDPVPGALYFAWLSIYWDLEEEWSNPSVWAEERFDLLRCALFLQSRQPYGWPQRGFCARIAATMSNLIAWITSGRVQVHGTRDEDFGCEREAWPFRNRAEYEAALKAPRLLCGKQAA